MSRGAFFLLALSFVLLAEGLSWITVSAGPAGGRCLVEPEYHAQANGQSQQEDCPTFFAGSILVSERIVGLIKRDDNDKAIIAAFTVILAASTIGLWGSTRRLWVSADQQARITDAALKLARDEFNATHRPRIQVREFKTGEPGSIVPDTPVYVLFKYVNVGDTPAHIFEIGTKIVPASKPKIDIGIIFVQQDLSVTLASGEEEAAVSENTFVPTELQIERNGISMRIYCVGYIRYRDDRGIVRKMGFSRYHDVASGRWEIAKGDTEDLDYEYCN